MNRFILGTLIGSILASGWLLAADGRAVGTRKVALRSGDDFSSGELQGVAVDSVGRVRAGFNLGSVPVADATTVWAALRTKRGAVLLATGNEGKLLEYSGGAVKEVASGDALALTSLVEAWDDTIIVGALPGAKLFTYKGGKLSEWLSLPDTEHIFQLAYDPKDKALYAATGPQGKLYRITRDKKAQVYFDAEEEHLTSVAVGNGMVYAGGGDKAKLYQLSAPGRASVLYDFGRTEVRAIVVGKNGDVFAIANELKGKRSLPSKGKTDSASKASTTSSSSSSKGKGTLYRFDKRGAPEQLLDDKSEHFTSLTLDAEGVPYVGTGAEGKLYTVDDQRNSVLLADTDERQITALDFAGKERLVLSSDPLVVRPVRSVGGADSTWTSEVVDAGLRAHFGRLDWVAEGELEVMTRSGNSEEPDDTWSPWSAPLKAAGDVSSPPARFFQVRARFGRDPRAVLSEIGVSFVTDNLRAIVTSIDFDNAATKATSSPGDKLASSGGPISGRPQQNIDIRWNVDNPDKDDLRYWLEYRQEGTKDWFSILQPGEKLTKSNYSWDTSDLPEGQYRVRVVASDSPANPPDQALKHQLESHVVVVDNTPPVLENLRVEGRTLRGVAKDGVGPIARIEVAIAGTDDWYPIAPADGVFDETTEDFRVDLSSVVPPGAALLAVRAFDQEKNQVVGSVLTK